jgi:uncharacterized protein (TIGR02453 family)
MLQQATLQFLKQLKKNNDKSWFDAHRPAYEGAKADFAQFIQQVLDAHAHKDEDLATLKAKDCLFRINRDIRFSANKAPYKTNMGASLDKGGKKSIYAGYYIHCEPGGNSFVGGGLWMPMPPELKNIRQEIDYCWDEFRKIIKAKSFVTQYGELSKEEYSLVNVPKGYEKDNPAAEYLKLKCFIAIRSVSDAELTDKGLLKTTLKAFEALQPLLGFLNRAIANQE